MLIRKILENLILCQFWKKDISHLLSSSHPCEFHDFSHFFSSLELPAVIPLGIASLAPLRKAQFRGWESRALSELGLSYCSSLLLGAMLVRKATAHPCLLQIVVSQSVINRNLTVSINRHGHKQLRNHIHGVYVAIRSTEKLVEADQFNAY